MIPKLKKKEPKCSLLNKTTISTRIFTQNSSGINGTSQSIRDRSMTTISDLLLGEKYLMEIKIAMDHIWTQGKTLFRPLMKSIT